MSLAEELTQEDRRKLKRLASDFPYYAGACLKIRPKAGALATFQFNRVQRHLHEAIEDQRGRTGKVRKVILKGRQQGCSTYVGARFYHKVSTQDGLQAYILTHENQATDNLFGMVSRYYENSPGALRPPVSASNAKELVFAAMDSGFRVGTAGTKGTGRSLTIQLFHGSEVAFWPHAEDHTTGVLQAVPDMAGTEIILESTANGIGNFFHATWQQAVRGEGDFEPIFIPWFWQEEYSRPVAEDFALSAEEMEYRAAHGLTPEQIAWRRAKIAELKDEWKFRQEYPATAQEAFETSGDDSFVPPQLVFKARRTKLEGEPYGALVIGVDPAGEGEDSTAIVWRRGPKVLKVERHNKLNSMAVAGLVARIMDADDPDHIFIDKIGIGDGTYHRLNELGYGSRLTGISVSELVYDKARYVNGRAEIWGRMKEWLEDGPVQIPDDDALHADLTAPRYTHDSNQRIKLESKKDMRARGVASPDAGDALALTFAAPVRPRETEDDKKRRYSLEKKRARASGWAL